MLMLFWMLIAFWLGGCTGFLVFAGLHLVRQGEVAVDAGSGSLLTLAGSVAQAEDLHAPEHEHAHA